jgi:hypothetical protein
VGRFSPLTILISSDLENKNLTNTFKMSEGEPGKEVIDDVSVDMAEPTEWKKYQEYALNIDPDQDDKATEIKLVS